MWNKLTALFSGSETIFWARVQVLIGGLWAVLEIIAAIDPYLFAPVLGDHFNWFLIVNGILTEVLRRRRATDL